MKSYITTEDQGVLKEGAELQGVQVYLVVLVLIGNATNGICVVISEMQKSSLCNSLNV
jgi:hypothetical protein